MSSNAARSNKGNTATGTRRRPVIPVNSHGRNANPQLLMIYARLRQADQEVRIYFHEEKVPRYLYGSMRMYRLSPLRNEVGHEHQRQSQKPPGIQKPDGLHGPPPANDPPELYLFRPWAGLELIINPADKSFFVKTATQEYSTRRDGDMKLIFL